MPRSISYCGLHFDRALDTWQLSLSRLNTSDTRFNSVYCSNRNPAARMIRMMLHDKYLQLMRKVVRTSCLEEEKPTISTVCIMLCFLWMCFQRKRGVLVTRCVRGAAGARDPASVRPARVSSAALSA